MEQISFIISDTATVNNLGLCRALIQADMLARYLTTQNITTGVTYYLCESTDYSKFNQYLEEFTDLLGLLSANGINTIERDKPDDWPESNFLYYPKEHGLSPYALCKIELDSIRSNHSQTVIEYCPLQLVSKSITITSLFDKGFTTEQIRYALAAFPMNDETVPIEHLSAMKKLGDINYRQSLLIPKLSTSEDPVDKSAIGSYHRKLG